MTGQDMTVIFDQGRDGAIVGFNLIRGTNTYPAKKIG